MKPLRGSNRDASKVPKPKGKNKTTKEQKGKKELKTQGSAGAHGFDKRNKAQKRKAETSSQPPIIKGQENWKQMPVSSLADLEKILDLSLLATLAQKQNNKKEFQEHLNALKKRFIEHCSTLKVPGSKQKQEGAAYRLLEETKKSETEKQVLSSLEENLMAVMRALEKNEEETNALEHQCSVLRNKVQDQEEQFEEVFQRKEAVGQLRPHWLDINESTLEAKMRKAVPDGEAETMAKTLGEILQKSESLQDAQELLTLAHRHMDEMFYSQRTVNY